MYCIVYRMGGTENFQWRASLGMDKPEATKRLFEMKNMGYACMIWTLHNLYTIGLPETY